MRETEFIARNKDKWARYEQTLKGEDQDPEVLEQLYVHTTDDLSYARTFYPNRSVRVYLNSLARRTFLQVYRGRRGETGRFFTFWTDELPRTVFAHRRPLLISLLTFVLAMLIGVVSYRIDPGFAESILGEAYVRMTNENIASGDPMRVYKEMAPFSMSLRITLNNVLVALLTFVAGAFFAVGALTQLVRNGVMVGVFQYFFYDQGLFQESFLTIWVHGALEISSIVIAGGAGLTLGSGLLFPGSYSRLESFKTSARAGLKILLGTVPLFIIAGFLEGYLTRHTETPDAVRGLFILLCFAFMVWYYVIYPRAVAATPRAEPPVRLPAADPAEEVAPTRGILSVGDNMTDTFRTLRANVGRVLAGAAVISLVFGGLSFGFYGSPAETRYAFSGKLLAEFANAQELLTTFSRNRGLGYLLLVAAYWYGVLRLAFSLSASTLGDPERTSRRAHLRLLAVSGVLALGFAFGGVVSALFVFLALPFLMMLAYARYTGQAGTRQTFRYVYTNLVRSYDAFFLLLLLMIPAAGLIDSTMGAFFFSFLDWIIYTDDRSLAGYNVVLQAFTYGWLLTLALVTWGVSFALRFGDLQEIETAGELLADLEDFGTQRRLRGMEMEK